MLYQTYSTAAKAIAGGESIHGRGNVIAVPHHKGWMYSETYRACAMDSATTSKPIDIRALSIKGLRELAKSNVSIDEFANAVEAVAASNNSNEVATATDSATDSTNDELAWFVLNNIDKLSKHAVANDDTEQENEQFAGDSDPFVKQYQMTKDYYNNIHKRNAESAKRDSEAARNRFKR